MNASLKLCHVSYWKYSKLPRGNILVHVRQHWETASQYVDQGLACDQWKCKHICIANNTAFSLVAFWDKLPVKTALCQNPSSIGPNIGPNIGPSIGPNKSCQQSYLVLELLSRKQLPIQYHYPRLRHFATKRTRICSDQGRVSDDQTLPNRILKFVFHSYLTIAIGCAHLQLYRNRYTAPAKFQQLDLNRRQSKSSWFCIFTLICLHLKGNQKHTQCSVEGTLRLTARIVAIQFQAALNSVSTQSFRSPAKMLVYQYKLVFSVIIETSYK